jgi:hypothetical protein
VSKYNHTQKYQKDTQSVIFNTQLDKRSVVFILESVVFILKQTLLSVETTLAEALFLCRNKCRNDTPVFTVHEKISIFDDFKGFSFIELRLS